MQLNNQPTNQPIKPNLNHPTNQPTLCRSCLPLLQQEGENDGAEELGIANLGGVYFVLFVGSIFASIYGFVEWICHVYGTARRNKVSFKTELIEEFRFVMQCSGNTRPVKYPKNSSRSRSRSSRSRSHSRSHSRSSSKSSTLSVDSLPLDESKLHHISEHTKHAK
uniref:Uncharacterized protein n=1 Tax=Ceratitis capitata TaxID=7213 RepID=W8B651_CERCA